MQNFSKLYRQIKTQASQRTCFQAIKRKSKGQIIQKYSDLSLKNVSINGNKLCFKQSPRSLNKSMGFQNAAIKCFTSFENNKRSTKRLKSSQQFKKETQQHCFLGSNTNNTLTSSFQIERLRQILHSSSSLKKNSFNKLYQRQKSSNKNSQINKFCKYRNKILKSKIKRSSNLLQDKILGNIDIQVHINTNNNKFGYLQHHNLNKVSLQFNNNVDQEYQKLQEIKKIVAKIQQKNKSMNYPDQLHHLKNNQGNFKIYSTQYTKNGSHPFKTTNKQTEKQIDADNLQPWQFN